MILQHRNVILDDFKRQTNKIVALLSKRSECQYCGCEACSAVQLGCFLQRLAAADFCPYTDNSAMPSIRVIQESMSKMNVDKHNCNGNRPSRLGSAQETFCMMR